LTAATNITAGITTAVWEAGTRTLTAFGTLVYDIWDYAMKTIVADGAVVTYGGETNTYTATQIWDTTRWWLTPAGPGDAGHKEIDFYMTFTDVVKGHFPISLRVVGYFAGTAANEYIDVYAWNYITALYDKLTTDSTRIEGATSDQVYDFALTREHIGSAGKMKIRFYRGEAVLETEDLLYLNYVCINTYLQSYVPVSAISTDIWAAATRTLTAATNITAGITTAVWASLTASHTTTGSFGKLIGTNLDATISSVATAVSGVAAAVWAVGTRTLTSFGTLAADAATAVWGAVSRTITGTVTVGTNNDKSGYALTVTPAVAGDKMDLVDAPNATALTAIGTAVWATTSRVLTAATNITADIAAAVWGYVTRTITEGGITAQQVWEYATRILTASTNITDRPGIAAAVWNFLTRNLSATGQDNIISGVWGCETRSLTDKAGFTLHADYDPAKTAAQAGDAMTLTADYDAAKTAATAAAVASALESLGYIQEKTDKMNFTDTDIKATLDSEKVTVSSNEDKTGYALTAAYDAAKTAASLTALGNAQTAITDAIAALNDLSVADIFSPYANVDELLLKVVELVAVVLEDLAPLMQKITDIKERTDNLTDHPADVSDVHVYEQEDLTE
jgi:hypothetical protein